MVQAAALEVGELPRMSARPADCIACRWIRMARAAGADATLALGFADRTLSFTRSLLGMLA